MRLAAVRLNPPGVRAGGTSPQSNSGQQPNGNGSGRPPSSTVQPTTFSLYSCLGRGAEGAEERAKLGWAKRGLLSAVETGETENPEDLIVSVLSDTLAAAEADFAWK